MKNLNNYNKKIIIFVIFAFLSYSLFAISSDLATRFLDKANEAYEGGNVENAYKYVNQALAVAHDEETQASVLFFAQTVYKLKLEKIKDDYDEMAFLDIKMNLERYPSIVTRTISTLITQIEKKMNPEMEPDITKITVSVGCNLNYLNINETKYFLITGVNTIDSATVLEIAPLSDNICKLVVAVPLNKTGVFQNYVIYVKKGDLLKIGTLSQVGIGIVDSFQYNKITLIGAAQ